ncbi:MAG: hypothetical protein QNK37_37885 [Acidobacteriota bacterium]|nr:hypothetical protein [Acidobacteriota bacterium]
MKYVSLFLLFGLSIASFVTAGKEVPDPFDSSREFMFDAPAVKAGKSTAKRLYPASKSMILREDLAKLAKKKKIYMSRLVNRTPKVLDSESGIMALIISITIVTDLDSTLAFFEALDDKKYSFRIERLDMMPAMEPPSLPISEDGEEAETPMQMGSMLETKVTFSTLSFRRNNSDEWPDQDFGHAMTGVVPNLIYRVAGALPYHAYLTRIKIRKDEIKVQGRTRLGDREDLSLILQDIPFLVNVQPVKPDTKGPLRDQSLFASLGFLPPE